MEDKRKNVNTKRLIDPNATYYVSSGKCALALQGLKNVTVKGDRSLNISGTYARPVGDFFCAEYRSGD